MNYYLTQRFYSRFCSFVLNWVQEKCRIFVYLVNDGLNEQFYIDVNKKLFISVVQ